METNLPGTEMGTSLSGLVLESDSHGAGKKAPLNAASPMVSGFGRFEEIADVNCKVIVEAEEGQAEKAKQMIREAGGSLESPHFNKLKVHEGDQGNMT